MKRSKQLPAPGAADVPLELDGKTVYLKPSLEACIGVSRMDNSPTLTANKVTDMDFDTIVSVIAFGLGKPVSKQLQESVFRAGVLDLRSPVIRFIHTVNNGGRPIESVIEDEDEEENPPVPSQ